MVKVIKSKEDYEQVMAEIDELLDLDPDVDTPEGDRLELLALLAQDYEAKHVDILPPTPVEAIKFRMEQQGLTQRDLIPYFGSRSKVSEILSGKRPLTLSMIRALHSGLCIPFEVLAAEQPPADTTRIDWKRFPVNEMIKRGWIAAETALEQFLAPLPAQAILYRKSSNLRSARKMDEYALAAWSARVIRHALERPPAAGYIPGSVDLPFMQGLAQLSRYDDGPLQAREYLEQHGISFVVENHLPRTYLDGAAMMPREGKPVIALTLRYDRLDNFWFTLMHELAHLSLHLDGSETRFYFDDLDVTQDNAQERDADALANEALIPSAAWQAPVPEAVPFADEIEILAEKLKVHPAIVAGRVRFELKNYRILNGLVGHRAVRKLFWLFEVLCG